jgi:elongation factor Ts
MTAINAKDVMALRKITDAPVMDCKAALGEAAGNVDEAVKILRTKSSVKADKRSARVAAEGVVCAMLTSANDKGLLIELNCETDFVARDENFIDFTQKLSDRLISEFVTEVDAAMQLPVADGESVTFAEARKALVAKTGENVQLRRIGFVEANFVGSYVHGNRIAVLVGLDKHMPDLARDIAMHIAATNPSALDRDSMDQQALADEKAIYTAQAKESGKPANIVEKMVEGRIEKFLKESCLLSQPFVKDPDTTVADLLNAGGASIMGYLRYELGDGIEKEVVDFATEVQAQIKDA